MGGMGSGRPSGRSGVEGVRWLDINKLNRDNALTSGAPYTWSWSRNGQSLGSVSTRGTWNKVTITFRCQTGNGPWEDVEQSMPIIWKPCRFGGQRPFFVCTGKTGGTCCNRPAAKLYGAGKYFFCRRCYGLAYTSQSEAYYDRALRRAQGLRTQLGGTGNMTAPFPDRPKGMWTKTYQRHLEEAGQAEEISNQGLLLACQRIMRTSQKRNGKRGEFW